MINWLVLGINYMSIINRYNFTKNIYSDYLVIIYRLGNYYSFGYDRDILKYIKFNGNTNVIKRKGINYLVLNNLDIIEINRYNDNMYDYYLKIICIIKVINW